MAELIVINIDGQEVGVQYRPDTSEATIREETVASEMGMQVLAVRAIELRTRQGLQIPQALVAAAEAHTFHDLLRD